MGTSTLVLSEYPVCNITDVEVRPDGLCDIIFDRGPGWFDTLFGIDPAPYGGVQALDRVVKVGDSYEPLPVKRRLICGVSKTAFSWSLFMEDGLDFRPGSMGMISKNDTAVFGVLGWELMEDSQWNGNPEEAFIGISTPEDLSELGPLHARFFGGLAVASYLVVLPGSPLRYRLCFDFLDPVRGPFHGTMVSDRPLLVPPEFVRMMAMPAQGGKWEILSISRPLLSVLEPEEEDAPVAFATDASQGF